MRKYMDILNEALAEDMIDKSATPPEYEDKDEQHYEARRKTGFFGAQAAGCILMAKTTGRILIVLRSASVDQPHTWGNCGGAFDAKEERPVDAARREAHEETGYTGSVQMVPLYVFSKGTFKYSNFLAIVEDEFTPHLGWEADRAVWVNFGRWPKPLHFGLEALFSDAASIKTIKHYAEMFSRGEAALESVEVDEDLNLPAGVDIGKAIGNAADAVKQLAADAEANPDAPADAPAGTPAQGQQPAKPGQPAAKPGAPAQPAQAAPEPVPGAKKDLSAIKPQ